MPISKWRGSSIIVVDGVWCYSDTRKPVADNPNRPCANCGMPNRGDDHDPCLGEIPGVANACCGHGTIEESYIQFNNGLTIRGFYIDMRVKEVDGD